MSDIVIYLCKVVAIQGIFIGLYRLLFTNRIHYGLNRFYLLSSLLLSLVVPFIQNPLPNAPTFTPELHKKRLVYQVPSDTPLISEDAVLNVPPVSEELEIPGLATILSWIYLSIVSFFIIRSVVHLFQLRKLRNQSELVTKKWFQLFKTSHSNAFSFFKNVFIPKHIFESPAFEQILAHECVHVKQQHSFDRLMLDLLVSLFWFNPFIYLYRKSLIEVHEFQADAEVIRQFNDPIGYQEILYDQLQSVTNSGFVSHFNFSTIKKRIVMMNKSRNTRNRRVVYLLSLPILAFIIFAFTANNKPYIKEEIGIFPGKQDSIKKAQLKVSVEMENEMEAKQNIEVGEESQLNPHRETFTNSNFRDSSAISQQPLTQIEEIKKLQSLEDFEKYFHLENLDKETKLKRIIELTSDIYCWGNCPGYGPELPPPPAKMVGC